MRSLPPVATAALAFAAVVAVSRIGALVTVAPLVITVFLLAPIGASRGPPRPWIRFVLAVAGIISGLASDTVYSCPPDSTTITVYLLATPRGGTAPFQVEESRCEFRVEADHGGRVLAGPRVRLSGSWRQGQRSLWSLATSTTIVPGSEGAWRWTSVRSANTAANLASRCSGC